MADITISQLQAQISDGRGGIRTVYYERDAVKVTETFIDDNGDPIAHTYVAGFCDKKPGSPFSPVVRGIPAGILVDIKRALAERDAEATGQSLFDTLKRRVMPEPVQVEYDDDEYDDDSDA